MKKAQSTLEYAVVIAIVAAALISIQVYVKRGLQGYYRANTDDGLGQQYDPKNTTSDTTLTVSGTETSTSSTEEVQQGDKTKLKTTVQYQDDNTTRQSGSENVGPLP